MNKMIHGMDIGTMMVIAITVSLYLYLTTCAFPTIGQQWRKGIFTPITSGSSQVVYLDLAWI
ncbi:MAG: hypothetical protein MRZ79_06390 [Bacteroidia bacterium]|nr:hypothetical protein [Bacteroidia bacterium]